MKLELQSPVLEKLEINPADLLIDIAVGLYVEGKVTIGEAADVARMPQAEFRKLLGRLNVPIQYDLDDFQHDLAVLHERGVR